MCATEACLPDGERGQNTFHQLIDSGIHALSEQEYDIAFYCFNLAFGRIRKLVELNDPRLLLSLFGHLVVLLGVRVEDLVLHLVRYLMSMSGYCSRKTAPTPYCGRFIDQVSFKISALCC
jgi:hypothetical protein